MAARGKDAVLLLAGVLLVCCGSAAQNLKQKCTRADDRCLPIRYCPPYFNPAKTHEQVINSTFKNQLRELACQPEKRINRTLYVCCPKEHIRCSWNDKPGICALPELCPSMSSNANQTDREPSLLNEANLCYVHNQKKFYCCPDPMCAIHSGLCDADDDAVLWQRSPSAFPRCEGAGGTLVPGALCTQSSEPLQDTHRFRKTCCKPSNVTALVPHPKAALLARLRCGIPGDVFKVEPAWETQRGEFPWMVVLKYQPNDSPSCAGTLVHSRYVLTAAQCIVGYQVDQVQVQLGVFDFLKSPCKPHAKCPSGRRVQSVEKMIAHDVHDVGLLRLSDPAELVPGSVEPICLPLYDSLLMHLPTRLTITGWGAYKQLFNASSLMLKDTTQIVQTEAGCEIGHSFCAQGNELRKNFCPGDIGGPYQAPDMYNGSVILVQYGIISSLADDCAASGLTKGTLIGPFMSWILDNMNLE